jgi:hypothetical protein
MSPRRRSTEPLGAEQVDRHLSLEVVGVGVDRRHRHDIAGVADHDLDRPDRRLGVLGEGRHGRGVAHVEGQGDRLPAGGADLGRGLLAPLDAPGAEHDGVARGGEQHRGRPSDARRRAGDHGGATLGVGRELRHQRAATVVGRAAKPRTLTEWTRAMPSWWIS